MMINYNPAEIEPKWQKRWEEKGIYKTPKDPKKESKVYVLGMFPYPSGAGLHAGHVRIYTAVDILARYFRMRGKEVLDPIGWDAFGLPAENAALRERKNPNEMVPQNEANFKRQCQLLGFSYDWDREFSTADPSYYCWTQWLFLKLYSLGLIYRQMVPINWCPFCQTGLADEEVLLNGTHERCGQPVTKKDLPQWLFRITDYADQLLGDLSGLDWPPGILEMQKNWIGRSEGTEIKFPLSFFDSPDSSDTITVFTTRPDTLFGVTAVVVAPEHPLLRKSKIELEKYIERARDKSELERTSLRKEKTGVFTGLSCRNPINGKEIPVWVGDYVIGWYGGGAVMVVPGHDQRDFDFAKKYGLSLKTVIKPLKPLKPLNSPSRAFEEDGILVNSGEFSGLTSEEGRKRITARLEQKGWGRKAVSYHLRDWVFSRQRYWGEPIPLVYCSKCGDKNGVVPVPEKDLPVKLPHIKNYEPTGTGESPLATIKAWVNTRCPVCGGPARRETDTMPNWAGSCWYFLRFCDPKNDKAPFTKSLADFWHPVDWYLGGAEHAVLHLLYARFWAKAFYKLGLVSFGEPFLRLRSVGMVLGEDGRKMSKSFGNVVNPDEVVRQYGADTLRIYEMFLGPWEQAVNWDTRAMSGAKRFLDRVFRLVSLSDPPDPPDFPDSSLRSHLHRLIKKVGEDTEGLKFNTAIAAMMEFVNAWSTATAGLSLTDKKKFLLILAPFAPHLTEELWQRIDLPDLACRQEGSPDFPESFSSVHQQSWPSFDPKLVVEEKVVVIVQINGKLRDRLLVSAASASNKEKIVALALSSPKVQSYLTFRQKSAITPKISPPNLPKFPRFPRSPRSPRSPKPPRLSKPPRSPRLSKPPRSPKPPRLSRFSKIIFLPGKLINFVA
jgi:leucyl-tRNA synthetase